MVPFLLHGDPHGFNGLGERPGRPCKRAHFQHRRKLWRVPRAGQDSEPARGALPPEAVLGVVDFGFVRVARPAEGDPLP